MEKLKEHLQTIAGQLTADSTIEDVYEQLALLTDIEQSEKDERDNQLYTTPEVKEHLNRWLK